jgi:PAS domain S-box-containing protein
MVSKKTDCFDEDSGIIDVSQLRAQLNALSESPGEFLLILDKNGTLVYANPDFCRFWGQDLPQIRGASLGGFWQGKEREQIETALRECLASGGVSQENIPLGRDINRRRTFKWTFSTIGDERGHPHQIAVVGRDVSTEQVAEHLIREQDRQLRTVMANLPGMVYRCQDDEFMTPVFISEGAMALTGYSPEDLIDNRRKVFSELIHPADCERVRSSIRAAVETRRAYELTYRLVRRDGSQIWAWEQGSAVYKYNGQVRHLEGIIMDVTVQKRDQDARARLTTAIDQAGEGVLITDERGSIIYLNAAFSRDVGLDADALMGCSIIRLSVHPANNALLTHLRHALEEGQAWRGEVGAGPDSPVKNRLAATVSPVFDAESKLIHVVLITRNVSKERSLEDQLRQAQKMEAIGQLAGGVAHDFNNLLQVILSYTELLLESEVKSEITQSSLNHVYSATLQARDLVLQLLAFGRRQLLEPVALDLNELMDKMVLMLPRVLGEAVKLRFTSDRHYTVLADPGALEQVLMNLCLNARDAMPQGGEIDISLDSQRIDGQLDEQEGGGLVLEEGAYVRITVRDNGIGMGEDVMSHIFEPFFTTKDVGEGSGLGLSTVYGIVKQHKGEIRVFSEPGKGTTFWIYLKEKVATKAMLTRTLSGAREETVATSVLIVEDDPMVRKLMQLVFKKLGIKIDLADSFSEGITQLKQRAWEYDLVICDLELPDGRGSDLLTQVRLNSSKPKLILMTGFMNDANERNLAYECLLKPFSIKTLNERVVTLLGR